MPDSVMRFAIVLGRVPTYESRLAEGVVMKANEQTKVMIEDARDVSPESVRAPVSGVFRVRPQATAPTVIERLDALAARMRSAASLLSQNRPRDGRDD